LGCHAAWLTPRGLQRVTSTHAGAQTAKAKVHRYGADELGPTSTLSANPYLVSFPRSFLNTPVQVPHWR